MARRKAVSSYMSPGRHAADTVIGFIDHTHKSLDIAVYSITHDGIAAAVIRAHQRGVKVRVLVDKTQAAGRYADDELLETAGVPLRRDTQSGLMHHKFAISDKGVSGAFAVATGSFNWTANADKRNAENFLIIRLSRTVQEYQDEFDMVWAKNAPAES